MAHPHGSKKDRADKFLRYLSKGVPPVFSSNFEPNVRWYPFPWTQPEWGFPGERLVTACAGYCLTTFHLIMPRASSNPKWFNGKRTSEDSWEVQGIAEENFLNGMAVYPRDGIEIEIIRPQKSLKSRDADRENFYQVKVTPPATWWAPPLGSVADSPVFGSQAFQQVIRPDGLKPQKFPEWQRDGIGYVDWEDEQVNEGLRQEQLNQMFSPREWKIFGPGLEELQKEWQTPIEEMSPVDQERWDRALALRELGERHQKGDLDEYEYELAKEALAEEK